MAIKRVTIELDDSPEGDEPTSLPSPSKKQEFTESKKQNLTGVPAYKESEATDLPDKDTKPPATTGRTYADLFSESANNPRAMATFLMLIPFVIFVLKIDSIESMKLPVVTGIILNIVWFGVPLVTRLYHWISNRSS